MQQISTAQTYNLIRLLDAKNFLKILIGNVQGLAIANILSLFFPINFYAKNIGECSDYLLHKNQ